jgi:hypothetical protein
MLTWLRCTVAHRRMHKLRDVFWLKAKGQVLEYWGCRVCPRRWRQRRDLSGAVRLPAWCIALLTWVLTMLLPLLLLSGVLEGLDVDLWERPY